MSLLFFIYTALSAHAYTPVSIYFSPYECAHSYNSTYVSATVGQENFIFSVPCRGGYYNFFYTREGSSCQVQAESCYAMSYQARLELRCNDGGSASGYFYCPKD